MSQESMKRSPKFAQENILKYSVGIDMSKDKFDAGIGVINEQQVVKIIGTRSFTNEPKGFAQFSSWVKAKCKWDVDVFFTMEATGVYYESLAWFLYRQDLYVSVVLPNKARRFMESLGLKSKNDKIDAKGLAWMGAVQRLQQWQAPDETFVQLRSLTRHRQSLQESRTVFNNQLDSIQCREFVDPVLVNQLNSLIDQLDKYIKEAEKETKAVVARQPEMMEKVEKITRIKGVGFISAITVLAETGGFSLFKNQRQLVSFAGYDIVENSSGKHVGKTRISKKGNAHIRRILHMPAFCVVKYKEPAFKALYDRVYETTHMKMKAYVAVQRKLLVLIYTLWKNGQDYIPNLPVSLS
jgi:transposase